LQGRWGGGVDGIGVIVVVAAHEVTKTIAAFLNTSGGMLLVGVNDSGAVLGIEPDFGYCQAENRMPTAGCCR
jgi:hypothetical protein